MTERINKATVKQFLEGFSFLNRISGIVFVGFWILDVNGIGGNIEIPTHNDGFSCRFI